MAVEAHIAELQEKHRKLDHEIETEVSSPGCDTLHISALKREKLRGKEELERLRSETRH